MMKSKWVIDDFLNKTQFKSMMDSFPLVLNKGVRAMNDIYCGDKEYALLDPSWKQFHDLVFSKDFWLPYLPGMARYPFRKTFLEDREGTPCFQLKENFLYARIDIGVATKGYGINNGGHGLHIDNKQRVMSGLLYFTDQSELEGGEFMFCNAQGETLEKIELKENRCILSLQDKDAWHKVNPLRSGIRKFVYFSLNATWPFFER